MYRRYKLVNLVTYGDDCGLRVDNKGALIRPVSLGGVLWLNSYAFELKHCEVGQRVEKQIHSIIEEYSLHLSTHSVE